MCINTKSWTLLDPHKSNSANKEEQRRRWCYKDHQGGTANMDEFVKEDKLIISTRKKLSGPDSAHGPERAAAQSTSSGLIHQPLQDVLLVLCEPIDVSTGPLDGLIQGQGPRTKSNVCVVLLKLLQLLTKAAEKKSVRCLQDQAVSCRLSGLVSLTC